MSLPSPQPAYNEFHAEVEINFLQVVNVLLRRWKLVVGLPIGAAFVTAVISLIVPPTFTASTAFLPELAAQGRLPSGIAGLAGQFGLALPTEAGQTAEFYAQVVKSPEIMNRVLLSRFADPRSIHKPPDSTTLLAILRVRGDSLADSLHNGRKKLEDLVSARVDNRTNIVTLGVDSRHPVLAAAVANRFVEYMSEFNAQTRQSQARERRRFVEQRLGEAERELQQAEQAIKLFYQRNRTWEQSPQLRFENDQLQRRVQIRQEVSLTLWREFEMARIEEVNDSPIITVINSAAAPQERSKPKGARLVVLAFALGGVAGTFAALGRGALERAGERDREEFRELTSEWSKVKSELRSIFWWRRGN